MEKVKTLGKVYLEKDVLTAAKERLAWIFAHFEAVYLAASGGKDSSVMVQLADLVARPLGRRFDVLYIDMEAQYAHTIAHIQELKTLPSIDRFYHVALPLALRNAVSTLQPKWICWMRMSAIFGCAKCPRMPFARPIARGMVPQGHGI